MEVEKKEMSTDSVLTTMLEVTKATTEATQVKCFTPDIDVQETCNAESRILNKQN